MDKFNIKKGDYTKQEIISLLSTTDHKVLDELYGYANQIRREYSDNIVHVRAILEFSNHCFRNCAYCGIRKSSIDLKRYRIEPDEIIKYALKAESLGFKTILLQSGEDFYYTVNTFEHIIRVIKEKTELKITLSIGERPETEYGKLKKAGADRFLLKHETSDPVLYRMLHPNMRYANRIKCLKTLKSLGYETGTGIMVGIPGQTLESIANDILLFKLMDIDMISIGPYIPHPSTPLARKFQDAGGYFIPAIGRFDLEEMIYKIIAITRIITKKTHLPATTGFNVINENDTRKKALYRGANVIMVNITDSDYRKFYEIYPAKAHLAARNIETLSEIREQLSDFRII